ncbi:ketoacyl-ACP synthase III [Balneolaceae bacterium YR4-1]|uniref:Ketoacyl-ACP synthase III n=1 Tax=Halalkalibaculum roseum TaxID=2709311 RepID=A0A6M1SYW6_9BACT|nr:ketoacyl-ACP synthase III [Halalkalibaculum roseum]NGP77518.1 ketoacyl-ACP synthase III [Halalkalibaculum roseum]
MSNTASSVITGTGSYIPRRKITNNHFLCNNFLNPKGEPFDKENKEIIEKFTCITGIKERRYASDNMLASDMGAIAGKHALESAQFEPENLDFIIVAHNFGDIRSDNRKVNIVPSLASRIKHQLGIQNPNCVAYDLPFGCPGWLQGVIQSDCYIRSGDAQSSLVIGTETLSRVCDPHDRDSMIYADGAGAVLLESRSYETRKGVRSYASRTDSNEAYYLRMETSYNPECDDTLYLKMDGRKLYQYALTNVPVAIKTCLDKAGIDIDGVSKLLIHQANAKMDEAILERLFQLYDKSEIPAEFMPMTISRLGNSSVATVPTLLDLVRRRQMNGHQIDSGDVLVLASVGAGMNINAVTYELP